MYLPVAGYDIQAPLACAAEDPWRENQSRPRREHNVGMTRSALPTWTQSRWWRILAGVFGWAVIPAIAVLMLVAVTPELGNTIRIAAGQGESGVFTAAEKSCTHGRSGTRCEWRGRFDGDDGSVRQPVYLEGDPRGWQSGTTAQVVWLDSRPSGVSLPHDPRPLLLVAGLSLLAAAVLTTWAVAAVCRVSQRRPPSWIARLHRWLGWPPAA